MSSFLEALKSPTDEVIGPFYDTLMRSAPDSIFMGTILLAILTQSYSLAVLTGAILELVLAQNLFGSLFKFMSGTNGGQYPDACGLMIPSYTKFSLLNQMLTKAPFPSSPIFIMSGLVAYFLGATINMKNEIASLSQTYPEILARLPISSVLSILFLTSFLLWRVLKGCDSLLPAMGSVAFGILIGTFILLLNIALFGRESINFNGLPFLVNRAESGAPLYVCSTTPEP